MLIRSQNNANVISKHHPAPSPPLLRERVGVGQAGAEDQPCRWKLKRGSVLKEHNQTTSGFALKIATVWRGLERVTRFLGTVGTGCILALMILTTTDVVLRYVLGIPLKGAYEVSEMLMVSSVFLGMAYTQLFHEHINADFLVSRLSRHTNLVTETVLLLPALLIYGLLAWQGAIFFVDALRTGEYRWGLLRIPLWPARLMVPLGASFLCLRFIGEIVINFRRLLNWNKEAS